MIFYWCLAERDPGQLSLAVSAMGDGKVALGSSNW